MELGVYFDAWYKHNHCYHPSLPLRSRQMIEDLESYHATVLAWAGLGGGSISLPYLAHEAFGPVDPRMQLYGFMNDSEFVAECSRRGIRLFGVVFEVQGWEFPAVFDEEGKIKRLNLLAQETEGHGWYGLREFSRDTCPAAFPTSLKDYYPDGIRDEDGNLVEDLLEACCTRDRFGAPIHARWVEVKGHREEAYQMCRNNPVWREYLKKVMELQIDAGVPGIQLDECELPMTSISSGGCFCASCMKQFSRWLKERKTEGKLPPELEGVDLDTFHYGKYLKDRGCSYPEGAPLYRVYWEFQVRQVRKYFGELADHARAYAKEKYGRTLEISGNFFNMQPAYYPIENKVDLVITEMEHTLFRQPCYYRYCAGFAAGKPVIVAENPYGGIVPRMLEMLDRGKGYDLYRIFLLEASMYGCNMSVPYGGWMGNTIKDSFWPPREVTAEVQDFLYEHASCFPRTRSRGAAVLYGYASYSWRDSSKGSGANGMQDSFRDLMDATAAQWLDPESKPVPFWDFIRAMSAQNAQYDVVMLPDGDLRADDLPPDALEGYPLVIVPDCFTLTERQQSMLKAYAKGGGKVLAAGRLAEGTDLAQALDQTGNAVFVSLEGGQDAYVKRFMKAFEALYGPVAPVECRAEKAGVQRYDADGKTWIHVMNYRYDESQDQVLPFDCLRVRVPDAEGKTLKVFTPRGVQEPQCVLEGSDLMIRNAGVYTLIELA